MRGKQTQLGRRSLRLLTYTIAGLAVTVAGSSVPPPDTATLWASGPGGALAVDASTGEVYFDISTNDPVHAVAVDRANSRVWLQVGSREVAAYDRGGQKRFSVRAPRPLTAQRRLEVDPVSGDVWLADPFNIYRIEVGTGIVLHHEQPASEHITGGTLDPARSRFWYATRDGLTALWPNGRTVQRVPLTDRGRSGDPRIAYDSALDRLWVAGNRRLARYDADGTRTFVTDVPTEVTALAPDGRGGLWLASRKQLQHIDRSGLVEFTLRPFAGRANLRGNLQALVVDPETGGVWIAGRTRLHHYALDGSLRHIVDARAPDGDRHPLADIALPRRAPIEIVIESPHDGALINDNMPPVATRIEEPGEIGAADLTLNANGETIPSVCQRLDTEVLRCTPTMPLPEGGNELMVQVHNEAGTRFDSEPVRFTVDTVPPEIDIAHPPRGLVTNEPALTVTGTLDEPVGLMLNGETVALDAGLGFTLPLTLAEGENALKFRATDLAGNVNTTTRRPLLDTEPPAAPRTGLIDGGEAEDGYTTVSGKAGSIEPDATVEITNTRTGASVTVQANEDGAFTAEIEAEPGDEFAIVARDAAGNESKTGATIARGTDIPPDPKDVAPPLPATGSPALAERIGFLYQGDNPIQQGVAPDTIEDRRVAVLRGEVRDRTGNPLPGVRIGILDRPELGWTHTQLDGGFDMAVNGGGALTVVYEKDGYLPVQRTVETEWGDWYRADDVVMIPLDDKVTTVDLTDTEQPFQVAQGSVVEDSDGERRATLLFPAGTTAEITLPDGGKQQLSQLDVRATEYTVGGNGPEAMPAQLPPSSAYTYAVELSVDQALAQGVKVAGKDVVFDRPVPFYVDNFLDFPTGEAVPTGYYDNDKAAWIPYDNGRVIEILGESDGLAILDVTGSGTPVGTAQLDELGITDAERARLAQLYDPGDSLWRVALTHLSTWDCNWPSGPPEDAEKPDMPEPEVTGEEQPENSDEENECPGCTISPQQQAVGESIAIAGTPYTLHYRSNRADGYARANTAEIPLTNDSLPASLEAVSLEISIAGAAYSENFPAQPNLTHNFTWDGRDGFGRKVYGSATATVTIRYRYPCIYRPGNNGFARFGNTATPIGSRSRCRGFYFTQKRQIVLQSPFKKTPAVAGNWSLDVHHAWDAAQATLIRGDGSQRSEAASLRRQEQLFAGTGESGFSGDGGPATEATLARGGYYGAHYLAAGPDGTVYIMDDGNHRIRAVGPNGIIRTVAGTGTQGYSGDNGPATEANIDLIRRGRIAVDADGNIYFAQTRQHVIRRIDDDGIITTVAGTGAGGRSGDGGPATKARLYLPTDVAFAPDGTMFISEYGNHDIRVVAPDGTISTMGRVPVYYPMRIWRVPDGTLYVRDHYRVCCGTRIWEIAPDGTYREVTRKFGGRWPDTGGKAQLDLPTSVLTTVGPGGSWYAPSGDQVLVRAPLTDNISEAYVIAARDGSTVYSFDEEGRHLATRDAIGGEVLHDFGFDEAGRLIAITDGDGNITTIERDDAGKASAIISPDGQRTELIVDESDHLTGVVNPAGERRSMQYTADGLLTSFTNPKDHVNTFVYNEDGRLIQDIDPRGGGWLLSRTDLDDGYEVTMTSGEGRVNRFVTRRPDDSTRVYRNHAPDGTVTTRSYTNGGHTTVERPDGTVLHTRESADPRFGMTAPVIAERRVTTPSDLTYLQTTERDIDVSDEADPFSLSTLTDTVVTNGRTATASYDDGTRQWTFTSPEDRVVTTEIDTLGRPLTQSAAGLEPVSTAYDARGRPAALRQGAGDEERTTSFDYYDVSAGGQAGYLRSLTDAAGRETAFAYDAAGRVTEQTLPDGRTIGYQYDANGNLIAITPPGRSAHLFEYDGLDQRTVYEPPELTGIESVTRYRYNLDRQPTSIERPGGESVTFAYDAGGRLASRSMNAGTTSYTYDVTTGQIDTIATTGGIDLSLAWDGFLPVQAVWSGQIDGSVARTYDNNLWLVAEAVNGNNIGFAYDDDGLLTRAGDMTLTRASDHGMVTATALAAITGSRVYNGFGELSARDVTLDGENIYDVSYERDKLGRIIAKTETLDGTVRSWSYLYDQAGRLTQVTLDGTAAYSYSYDANGNRIGYTGPDGNITGNYDAQDRIQSYGAVTYTHSPAGERETKTTSEGTTNYDYDAAGNLRRVELPDGTVIEYLIDGRDRRAGKKVDGQLVKGWLYRDRLNPVAELDGDGNVEARFIYGDKPNVPAYMIKDDKTYRIISDHLGSVRLVIDTETNKIAQRIDYSPFGKITVDTNPGFQPFTFAGGLYDPDTNLTRFGARDYDPEIGRWTAKDPILFQGGDTNTYGYVFSDPNNYVDITGRFAVSGSIIAAIAIRATVGAISSGIATKITGGSTSEIIRDSLIGGVAGAIIPGGSTVMRAATINAGIGSGSSTVSQAIGIARNPCLDAGDFNVGAVIGAAAGGAFSARANGVSIASSELSGNVAESTLTQSLIAATGAGRSTIFSAATGGVGAYIGSE